MSINKRDSAILLPLMSSRDPKPDARARIVRAATELLATGGRNAVTTRAVSAAAGVQAPTIYRQFGDMQGLLDVVARETLAVNVGDQATRALTNDPLEDLRRGWDLYVAFGLAHPDAFALLYSALSVAESRSARWSELDLHCHDAPSHNGSDVHDPLSTRETIERSSR